MGGGGAKHANRTPAAGGGGLLVVGGAIPGADPERGRAPADLDEQCRLMFENVRRVMAAAGGSPDDIVKMTVWVTDRSLRAIMKRDWRVKFPQPHCKAARHTLHLRGFTAPLQIDSAPMAALCVWC